MKIKLLVPIFLTILAASLSGCAVSTDDTIMAGPAPKTKNASQTERSEKGLPATVAILPFTNRTDSEFAYEVVRRTMANHFATTNYRWLHWQDVDSRLGLAGIESGADLADRSSKEIADILGVDGLLYGHITHYNKTFAGIYAQIAVGVELRFENARTGEVLWKVEDVTRSHAGGVSTSPVGLIMNALVAAKHLYGDINLYRAADELGRDLASELPQPAALSQREKPTITNVVHSGVGQYLNYGDSLEIGIEGDPGMTAVAAIDGLGIVDLSEAAPGQYVGTVNIDRSLDLDGVAVVGRLQDDFGQTASWVSPYGLLNVDNTPPGEVAALTAASRDNAVQLNWQPPIDADVAGYRVALANTETGDASQTFESENSEFTVTGLTNFEPVYISVFAVDRAGNAGTATQVTGMAAPDSRFTAAASVISDIPPVVSGVHRLTADGNPFYLRGESRIATDGVLLVGPGVEIEVSPNARLAVMGELHVFGNALPVTVSDASGQGFTEFLVLQSTLPVSITGLVVTGGGIPVKINAGSPLLADCRIADARFNAITIAGSARPIIRDCIISGAKATGVIVEGQSQPTFDSNTFIDNEPFHLQNGSTYQVNVTNNSFEPAASNTTILGDVQY